MARLGWLAWLLAGWLVAPHAWSAFEAVALDKSGGGVPDAMDAVDVLVGVVVGVGKALGGAPTGLTGARLVAQRRLETGVMLLAGRVYSPGSGRCADGETCDVEVRDVGVGVGRHAKVWVVRPKRFYPTGTGHNDGAKACDGTLFFYVHGGGFVFGSGNDAPAYAIPHETGCPVVSVDYRLAPEHVYPAAIDDVFDAWMWATSPSTLPTFFSSRASQSGERTKPIGIRVVAVGVSAGGNLVTALAHKLRNERAKNNAQQVRMPSLVVPVVPSLAVTRTLGDARFGHVPHLSSRDVAFFLDLYTGGNVLRCSRDPLCAPLAETNWTGLPPMAIAYASRDLLSADAIAYAQKLRAEGYVVPTLALRGSHIAPALRWRTLLEWVASLVGEVAP